MSNQQVRKGEELPEGKLKEFLVQKELIRRVESDLFVKQFTHGYSNLTYLLQIEEREFVLRKPPVGAIKRGHDMSREFRVQSKVQKGFSKVPQMFAYTHDESIMGSEFYIMEKVNGIILNYKEANNRNIGSDQYKTIADTWLNTFVELHQLDYKAVGLSDLGKPEGYVKRQVTNWGKQYLKAATEEVLCSRIGAPRQGRCTAWALGQI